MLHEMAKRAAGLKSFFAVTVCLGLMSAPGQAFDLVEAQIRLGPLFQAVPKTRPDPQPLFNSMVAVDLSGDGRREVVLPGSDGRLRVLRIGGTVRRPALAHWTTLDTRVEGDAVAGTCYLTVASLARGTSESLVAALPRGIFSVRLDGEPPRLEWIPLCDRTMFDGGQQAPLPQRLDFLADLDGDGTPEIWLPRMEGIEVLRRAADGKTWDTVQMPPMAARSRQFLGALPLTASRAQPNIRALSFQSEITFPTFRLQDLNGDGRAELLAIRRETANRPATLRAECYALRDPLHFTTAPTQVRIAPADRGGQTYLDLNGDGYLDLLRVESNLDIVTPRTVLEIFLSPPQSEFRFDQPSIRYTTHDPVGIVLYGDWNRDGYADVAFSQFRYTFGSTEDLISLVLGREVGVMLRFLHGSAGGYPRKPDRDFHFQIRNRSFHPRRFPPFSLDGDFNGDGAADLIVRTRPDRADVYLSSSGQIGSRPAKTLSMTEDSVWRIVDLNGDGRSDLITFDPEAGALSVWLSLP